MDPFEDLGVSTLFRCDNCTSAQAFMAAVKDDMTLMFCKHHGERHLAALDADGWKVYDKTHLLNEKPSVSASV